MSNNEMRPSEPLKRTVLDHAIIITVRRNDPFCLRPFQTFAVDGLTGRALTVADFTTLAAALFAHDQLVTKCSEE